MPTHLVIPDTQVKPGVPTDHLRWIGAYILDRRPDTIIHVGDHWDMSSLSSWDKGTIHMEGRRYAEDVESGIEALELINAPLARAAKWKAPYTPRRVMLRGNHEHRVTRTMERSPELDGWLNIDDLVCDGWEVHDFLEPVEIDGVTYAHYFYNPMSGRPFGGTAEHRLAKIGYSFTMGHQQTLAYALRPVGRRMQHGLIAGACYLHDEDYLGPQGNSYWRGIVVKHEVEDGSYDPMFVSLDYLCRKYEGVPLSEFLREHYGVSRS